MKADSLLDQLRPYIESGPSPQGEYRLRCPMHGERRASASVHPERGWYCQVCEEGGSLKALVKFVRELPDDDPRKLKAIEGGGSRKSKNTGGGVERLSEGKVRGWHEALLSSGKPLKRLMKARGLSLKTIKRFRLGWDRTSERYIIPVYDGSGKLVNLRKYKMQAESSQKVWNARGHGAPPRLFPAASLRKKEVLLCEGEMDAMLACQLGFNAVTGTAGAKNWHADWTAQFKDKVVYIYYDNDDEGRIGAKRAAKSIRGVAKRIHILPPLLPEHARSDLSDWVLGGGTRKAFRAHMRRLSRSEAKPAPAPPEPVDVRVIGSMDSSTNGRPLKMGVTVIGRKDPTYSVPHRVAFSCTMDAGAKCKSCPMYTDWEGDHNGIIYPKDVDVLSRFIDARKISTEDILREHFGIQKCLQLEITEQNNFTVEELYVMSSLDQTSQEDTDYTQRRIYNVTEAGGTKTNTDSRVEGTTWPSPKDRRNEFFSWDLQDAVTSLDSFQMTPDLCERLAIFQPEEGQTPLDKCMDIARDLSANVTGVLRRERMHVAMDLVWHSALMFPFENEQRERGWLQLLIVGDTRTGKSKTAINLQRHYGLGHVIGCEGATFAGLVGGVKEVGQSRTITWGELTLNDRRMAVLDEASGLSQDIIGGLSDIRSRGKAQITKIESATTNARVRTIWISNARKSEGVNEKRIEGTAVIKALIGNPEDIARFDLAMSVATDDVKEHQINDPDRPHVPHVYTSELCHDLILWAWSRTADQVQWKPDAYRHIFATASKLSRRYVEDPPLIQGADVRMKIARISVAMAARTFSTDDNGENIIVCKEHVEDAARFMDKLYSYNNFGYRRASKRARRNVALAGTSRRQVKRYLEENRRVFEFLVENHSFRPQDLEQMAHLIREEAGVVIGRLSDAKMITKQKSQIVVEPTLTRLLRELEDEQDQRRRAKAIKRGAKRI